MKDLLGKTYGHLRVLAGEGSRTDGLAAILKVRCTCGRECFVTRWQLTQRQLSSCWHCQGCKAVNESNSPEKIAYANLGQRANHNYRSFDEFLQDVGKRPSRFHQLRRKDTVQGHVKGNLCWRLRRDVPRPISMGVVQPISETRQQRQQQPSTRPARARVPERTIQQTQRQATA